MLAECPHCAQKLRPQWVRCPRCRQLLPQTPSAESVTDAPSGNLDGRWLVAAAIVVVVVVAAIVARREPDPQSGARVAQAQARPAAVEPGSVDTSSPAVTSELVPPPTDFRTADAKRQASSAYASGDYAGALSSLEEAVKQSPDDAAARNNLGQVLVRQGRAKDALPHFDAAVRLDESRWEFRFNRARAYGLLNRWEEAVAEYRVAERLFPDDHATLYNLGLAQMRIRDYAAAAATLERAVAAAPDEPHMLITLGTAYVGAEQRTQARTTFERFLRLAPEDPEAVKVKALLQSLAEAL